MENEDIMLIPEINFSLYSLDMMSHLNSWSYHEELNLTSAMPFSWHNSSLLTKMFHEVFIHVLFLEEFYYLYFIVGEEKRLFS